jgi:hypothetical protein
VWHLRPWILHEKLELSLDHIERVLDVATVAVILLILVIAAVDSPCTEQCRAIPGSGVDRERVEGTDALNDAPSLGCSAARGGMLTIGCIDSHQDRSGRSFMGKKLVQFVAIVATALYLVATGAHLFELPHKRALSPAEYMTVQQIYVGWELFGIAIAIAMLATLANTLLVRADCRAFAWSLAAFLALAATQVVFWTFTYPVNVATRFWTISPQLFDAARQQWEYSHAASAVLTFVGLVAIVISSLACQTNKTHRVE